MTKQKQIALSILIPVYEHDIRPLVNALLSQCAKSTLNCELLLLDDSSHPGIRVLSRTLKSPLLRYAEFNKNQGRSIIRNTLARLAKGSWLLFLDNDVLLPDETFIDKIKKIISAGWTAAYMGGVIYPQQYEADQSLHALYGLQVVGAQAKDDQVHSLVTMNLLMPAELFLKYKFDSSLRIYGHEDTLLGYQLRKNNIPLLHYDNPVYHHDLDSNTVYLEKNRNAISNLAALYENSLTRPALKGNKLIRAYELLHKYKLNKIAQALYVKARTAITNNLSGGKPSLLCFKIFKLGELLSVLDHKK